MPFISRLITLEEWISKALLVLIVVLVFFAAVMRSIGYPVPWSVDMAQLFFAWFAFLGASQALRRDSHIGVDVLTRILPERYQRIINIVHLILIGIFLSVIAYFGVILSMKNYARIIYSLQLSYSFISISVAFGSMLMLGTVISKLKKLVFPGSSF
jgi:TRAP-type C4-dicarboxylate transport system permease small subunit